MAIGRQKVKKYSYMTIALISKFHKVWTILENGQVAKSRRGLTFYSLCKIDG
jgi:hypothetical protein